MRAVPMRRLILAFTLALPLVLGGVAHAASRSELNARSKQTLDKLVARIPAAAQVSKKAVAVLVFPEIYKAGLMVGGQYGEGVLWRGGKPVGYYNNSGASYGLQAGAQKYGYAMFFMTEHALQSLDAQAGFEIGVGPTVVVVDTGMAKTMTNKSLTEPIYAFIFQQQGLMAGLGLQGNKITKIQK